MSASPRSARRSWTVRSRAPAPTTHAPAAASISIASSRDRSSVSPPSLGTAPPIAVEAAPRSVSGTRCSRAQRRAAAASAGLTGRKMRSGTAWVSVRVNSRPRYTFWSRSASPRNSASVTMRSRRLAAPSPSATVARLAASERASSIVRAGARRCSSGTPARSAPPSRAARGSCARAPAELRELSRGWTFRSFRPFRGRRAIRGPIEYTRARGEGHPRHRTDSARCLSPRARRAVAA